MQLRKAAQQRFHLSYLNEQARGLSGEEHFQQGEQCTWPAGETAKKGKQGSDGTNVRALSDRLRLTTAHKCGYH